VLKVAQGRLIAQKPALSLPKGNRENLGTRWRTLSRRGRAAVGTTAFLDRYNVIVPFAIRDFRPEDFDTLWQIDQKCFAAGIAYSRQELKVYVRRRAAFTLVATNAASDEIVGFVVAYGGLTGHIITIDVIAAARRMGVGSQLLRAAEDRLRVAGSRRVGLETAVDNAGALSFYKRHGYHVVGTWPRYYSNGVDALVMRKDLIPAKTA
jgi:ribosomal protein S18 acetylase RimI-like enzyme